MNYELAFEAEPFGSFEDIERANQPSPRRTRGAAAATPELFTESEGAQGDAAAFELIFEAEPFQGYTEFDETEWSDAGATRGEWEGEANRQSPEYVRQVQQALNRLLGLRLAANGVNGTQTRSAIRSFQKRRGLKATGVVDAKTEQALFATEGGTRTVRGKVVSAPTCEAAASDLEHLANSLKFLNNELSKTPSSQTRLKLLKELVRLDAEAIIVSLGAYIAAGCCEPSLQVLEADVAALAWPSDPDAQALRSRLLDAIRRAQAAAKQDHEHC
ncbi:MAG TPA: peptidoglycan-binding domain-containing protein [Pyrinomonadaceae bacterium]|nr:peptidoglycan-binding domain-containing protein [Pyrinomonadaceae bacterium]